MKYAALVLARGLSKSIPGKNLIPICGKPLILHVLQPLISCQIFHEVWVSTDDDQVSDTIKANFDSVYIHRRSSNASSDSASSLSAVVEFLRAKPDIEILCLAQATSPCLHQRFLVEAHEKMETANYDSVFAVTRDHKLRWSVDASGHLKAVNFDIHNRPRRQDWPGELVESGHFYWFKASLPLSYGRLQSEENSGFVEIPPEMSFELDEPWQIPIVDKLLESFYKSFSPSTK